eukprot:4009705-Lingulodinium_polyedra.AAC.1
MKLRDRASEPADVSEKAWVDLKTVILAAVSVFKGAPVSSQSQALCVVVEDLLCKCQVVVAARLVPRSSPGKLRVKAM